MDTSKYTLLAETLWAFLKMCEGGGGEGEVLIVKLDNVKACNEDCHSALAIYFVIIYYSSLKTNNRAIFLPCEVGQ